MILVSLFSLLFLSFTPAPIVTEPAYDHDYHVSKCQVHYRSPARALQITLHFFIDDMELALDEQSAGPLFLGTKKESEEADSLLQDYLFQNLRFTIDGEAIQPDWIGRETSSDLSAIWTYLEIPELDHPGEITITNQILLEVYNDQKNLLSFNLDGAGEVYYLFRHGQDTHTIRIPN